MQKNSASAGRLRHRAVWPSEKAVPAFVSSLFYYPGSVIRLPRKFLILCALGLGFFLQCNVITSAIGLRFLHITDPIVLAGILIFPVLYLRFVTFELVCVFIFPLTAMFILSALFASSRGDGEFYVTAFTYFYGLLSFFLVYILLREKLLDVFCWGILAGFAASTLLLILDTFGVPLSSVGLAFQFDAAEAIQAALKGEQIGSLLRLAKPGGIWAHGNEAGPVLASAAAAAAYLSERYRRLLIYILFVALYLASFAFTLNRSGLLTVIGIGALLYVRNFSTTLLVRSFFFAVIGFLVLAAVLPFGLFEGVEKALTERFLQDSNSGNNIHERLASTFYGVQVALEYPFGIGFTARTSVMNELSGLPTPHNGFLATSFSSGIFVAVGAVVSVVYLLLRRRKISFFFYTAITLTGGYLFEELNYNPVFMMNVGMLFAYVALDLDYRLFQSAALGRKIRARQAAYAASALRRAGSPARPGQGGIAARMETPQP
jgi:hypothetical protein